MGIAKGGRKPNNFYWTCQMEVLGPTALQPRLLMP